jgi:putative addiction module component (TIGR02574 family)
MNKDALLVEILRLPEDERRALIEKVSASLFGEEDFELTSEQVAELDRRMAEHERDLSSAIPAEKVIAGLRERFG